MDAPYDPSAPSPASFGLMGSRKALIRAGHREPDEREREVRRKHGFAGGFAPVAAMSALVGADTPAEAAAKAAPRRPHPARRLKSQMSSLGDLSSLPRIPD